MTKEKRKKKESESEIDRWDEYVDECEERNSVDYFNDTVVMCEIVQELISKGTDSGGGCVEMKLGDVEGDTSLGGTRHLHQGKNSVSFNRLRRGQPHHYPGNLSIIPLWRNVPAEWCLDQSEEEKFKWMQNHFDKS